MVDAIISTVLERLITLAEEEVAEQVRLVTGVRWEVEKLASNLRAIQAVLHVAEKRQVKDETVRHWLHRLRHASYDMEDVLDEWNTARLKLQIDGVDDHDNDALIPKKKVCSFFPAASCFCCKPIVLRRDIALKIKKVNETLDLIAKQKNDFHFAENVIRNNERADQRAPTISSESEICSRISEKNELIAKLLMESSNEQKGPYIISLVGMGGIGKTTLAQFAYNNHDVKEKFANRIWVCVSELFDEFRIARAIIEALTNSAPNVGEFQSLMRCIEDYVKEKKFLLVLDDLWNEDLSKWEPFYRCLKNCHLESKILITTRKIAVANVMKSNDIISIKVLSDKECWSIFEPLAFFDKSSQERKNLKDVGEEIVKKCKGLPLAVKIIASLLQIKKTENEWQNILKSEIWKLEEVERDFLASLLLSYNELPIKIKQCFTYCAVFPKDYEIHKKELIELWMAQGYLSETGNKEMPDIGEEYFNKLAGHSFFQDFQGDNGEIFQDFQGDSGKIFACKMHDIVHDFAQFLCGNECHFIVNIDDSEELVTRSFGKKKILHLMLSVERGPISIWDSVRGLQGLRSLLVNSDEYSWSSKVLPQLFDKLTCLRALDLSARDMISCRQSFIKEIPTNVKKLLHLKYLKLFGQKEIEKLPKTLSELYNLEYLDVSFCKNLRELPQGIGKLRKLMYLQNEGTDSLRYLPVGIGELISLRRVSKFVVGGGHDRACRLVSLKRLNLLRECRIYGLSDVSDVGEATRAELEKKKNLVHLELHFGDEEGRRENEEDETDERLFKALAELQPPPNLKYLWIHAYRGRRNVVPQNWIMSLINLRDLTLYDCRNCEQLPPLGKLQSLESLYIYEMGSVKRVGNEFLGVESDTDGSSVNISFPKLKQLTLGSMEELEEWDFGIAVVPCLSSLTIISCPELKALPDRLLHKTTLQNLKIQWCPKISHIRDIIIG